MEKVLRDVHERYGSWRACGRHYDINAGVLNLVANGHRRAPKYLLRAIQFELNAEMYERWKVRHADELNALVAWATAQTDLP